MSIIAFKAKDGTVNMSVSGDVTREAKEIANGKLVTISVRYGSKKYMDCKAWADSKVADIMRRLEHGDVVEVKGVLETREKDGKTYNSVLSDYIGVMTEDGPVVQMPEELEAAPAPAGEQTTAQKPEEPFKELEDDDEDLPF